MDDEQEITLEEWWEYLDDIEREEWDRFDRMTEVVNNDGEED